MVTAKTAAVLWPRGQAVKTSPFHGGNTGSIPVGVRLYADVAQFNKIDCVNRSQSLITDQLLCKNNKICRCGSIGRAADL